jgi:hypothetical protein
MQSIYRVGEELARGSTFREYQQVHGMSLRVGLAEVISSQLKGLRVERVAFVAALVELAGIGFAHAWREIGIWLIVFAVLFIIVQKRFQPYRSVIIRGYGAAEPRQHTTVEKYAEPSRSDLR